MKKFRLMPVWIAAACLLILSACGTRTGASNFYMASDNTGGSQVTSYTPDQDFFVFFDVSNVKVGTSFEAKWYVQDAPPQDPNTPFSTTDYTYSDSNIQHVYLQVTNDAGSWPAGHYRVDVYMDGKKIGSSQFSVQQ